LPWRFLQTPKNFWNNDSNKKQFIEWVGKQLGIKHYSDWYKVSVKDIKELGGHTLLYNYDYSLAKLLTMTYPEHNWETFDLQSKSSFYKKSQYLLKILLKTIFPKEGSVLSFVTNISCRSIGRI
jgi:hypothetical protein